MRSSCSCCGAFQRSRVLSVIKNKNKYETLPQRFRTTPKWLHMLPNVVCLSLLLDNAHQLHETFQLNLNDIEFADCFSKTPCLVFTSSQLSYTWRFRKPCSLKYRWNIQEQRGICSNRSPNQPFFIIDLRESRSHEFVKWMNSDQRHSPRPLAYHVGRRQGGMLPTKRQRTVRWAVPNHHRDRTTARLCWLKRVFVLFHTWSTKIDRSPTNQLLQLRWFVLNFITRSKQNFRVKCPKPAFLSVRQWPSHFPNECKMPLTICTGVLMFLKRKKKCHLNTLITFNQF